MQTPDPIAVCYTKKQANNENVTDGLPTVFTSSCHAEAPNPRHTSHFLEQMTSRVGRFRILVSLTTPSRLRGCCTPLEWIEHSIEAVMMAGHPLARPLAGGTTWRAIRSSGLASRARAFGDRRTMIPCDDASCATASRSIAGRIPYGLGDSLSMPDGSLKEFLRYGKESSLGGFPMD
jgi:hypothetical protein